MLRLVPQKESRWVELDKLGVSVKIRPLTTAVVTAAKSEAIKRVAALRAEAEAQEEAGFPPDPLRPGYANPDWRAGLIEQFVAEALLRFAAEEWTGVGDEHGNPLPLTPEAIQAFAQHEPAARAFLEAAQAPIYAATAEGNVSAPFSNGAGGTGASTAPDAAMPDAPPAH
jgi:hypothetical protein